jgi:hypothetical protein
VVVWARAGRPAPWPHVAVLAMGVGLALLYARTVAVGAVLLTPFAAAALQDVLGTVRRSWARHEVVALTCSTVLALVVAATLAPAVARAPGRVPSGMDEHLARVPAGTAVFAEYDLGGWLLLRHPQLQPVVDPRTEVFSTTHLETYLDARAAKPGWERAIDSWDVSYALLPADSPLAGALRQQRRWRTVAADAGFILLARS